MKRRTEEDEEVEKKVVGCSLMLMYSPVQGSTGQYTSWYSGASGGGAPCSPVSSPLPTFTHFLTFPVTLLPML